MLAIPPYRSQSYPPRSPQWVRFGDDALQEVMSVTDEAHFNLARKRDTWQPFHQERLQYHGLAPKGDSGTQTTGIDSAHSAAQTEGVDVANGSAQTERRPLVYQRDVAARLEPSSKTLTYQRDVSANILPTQKADAQTQDGLAADMEEEALTAAYEDEDDDRRSIDYDDSDMPPSVPKRKAEYKPLIKIAKPRVPDGSPIVKIEGASRSSTSVMLPESSQEDKVEISGMDINRNNDLNFWKEQSPNELRAQLNLRNPGTRGDWAFKDRLQLHDIVGGMIQSGTW